VKACVRNGRLVLDEPTDLPEGTEIELVPLDDLAGMTDEERARVEASLQRAEGDHDAGRLYSQAEMLAEIDKPR
jgi:hypothetical protein